MRSMTVVLWLCIVLGSGSLNLGCDAENPAPVAVTPPAPPPEAIQYPASAAHASYVYLDESGNKVLSKSLEAVPEPVRALTAISLGEKTNAPEGMVYVLDPSLSDARIGRAVLRKQEDVERETFAAWLGYDAGYTIWETAGEVVQLTQGNGAKKKGRRGSREAKVPVRSIEIVSINNGLSEGTQERPRRDWAVYGWKPVTMYWTKSCGVCSRARKWLKANDVPYTGYDIDEIDGARARWSSTLRRAGLGGGVPTFVIGQQRQVMQGWDEDRFVELAKR